jgi:hypothetical protein
MRKLGLTLTIVLLGGAGCTAREAQMSMSLQSTAFASGQAIPQRFTADGRNISPPLAWEGVPQGTQEFALICDDPDAPTPQPWVHWVIYKIPGDVRSLPEGVPNQSRLDDPKGALQGRNSWKQGTIIGWRGPAPPPGHGVHHYHFRLYALDAPLELAPGLEKEALLAAMKGHIIGEGLLIGTYQR